MTHLWTAEEIIEATDGRPLGTIPEGIGGISIDSRTLAPGDAFFAIKGDAMDGHDFVTAAAAAGAALFVVAEGKLPALGRLNIPMIVVPDVLVALEKLGVAARKRTKAKIIAVTGSAGKTSTKEALRHCLSTVGSVHASDKSFNNHWGVPLSLARMRADCKFAIFEIGMNHADEIRPLVKMVRPHVALITLVAAAHLGHFKSLAEIARAKGEIFDGLVSGGTALINRDDAHWKTLEKDAVSAGVKNIAFFGEHVRSTYRLLDFKLHSDYSTIAARIGGNEILARIGAPGRHMVQNALAVLACAHLVGAALPPVALALGDLQAEAGRGKRYRLRHPKGAFTLIDESYNANPASMKAALSLLKAMQIPERGKRIAVLGDMLELGSYSEKLHSELGELIVDAGAQRVFLGGEAMKALAGSMPKGLKFEYREKTDDLLPLVMAAIRPGDAIVVKSSKSTGFSRIVDAILKQFPVDDGAARASGQVRG
ncbi:MAG: UDP-N-acetylmuramoylalanyl-D-glutamyl-2,6-diaminopimelate--D-alanyl-D-alanine ligase [Rhizobiaceae bacterium]|nr:UDP-N-acetylmuramoylalanyl-D-glutamyl-2,6-diaminopimelate--D-alanyl-D-alanine ligase [Rhizobiaceae bacterium]